MSRNIQGILVIEADPDFLCFMCGKIAETRPYGPNGEEICYECGCKDPLTTQTQMNIRLFGVKDPKQAKKDAEEMLPRMNYNDQTN